MRKIKKKAKELSKNLPDVQARIRIFNFVRDIPYFVSSNQDPVVAMKNNQANCGQKAKLLKLLLSELDVKTRSISMKYRIAELPIPPDIIDLAPLEENYHLAVYAEIREEEVLLDATADPRLEKGGFIVNHWDGFSNTTPFVKAIKSSDQEDFSKELQDWLVLAEKSDSKEFVEAYNKYLQSVRKLKSE